MNFLPKLYYTKARPHDPDPYARTAVFGIKWLRWGWAWTLPARNSD